jgi:hypothetical protein
MAGIVGERAHVRGAHVEQMLGPQRAEGDALGKLRRAALDQHDLDAIAQQIDRRQRPAETRADDHDG